MCRRGTPRDLDRGRPRDVGARDVILGIETSCDETASALVSADGEVLASVVSSQADLHARFGGVVPEIASRRHLELVTPVVREALAEAGATLADVDRIAVTQGPGLVGALLVGLAARRADLAASYQRAIVRALVERVSEAAAQTGAKRIAIVGGVAANSALRAALPEAKAAALEYCTDNAAMIASAGRYVEAVPY